MCGASPGGVAPAKRRRLAARRPRPRTAARWNADRPARPAVGAVTGGEWWWFPGLLAQRPPHLTGITCKGRSRPALPAPESRATRQFSTAIDVLPRMRCLMNAEWVCRACATRPKVPFSRPVRAGGSIATIERTGKQRTARGRRSPPNMRQLKVWSQRQYPQPGPSIFTSAAVSARREAPSSATRCHTARRATTPAGVRPGEMMDRQVLSRLRTSHTSRAPRAGKTGQVVNPSRDEAECLLSPTRGATGTSQQRS